MQGGFVGLGRTPSQPDAPGNKRYEMIVDNKLKVLRNDMTDRLPLLTVICYVVVMSRYDTL